MKTMKRRGWLLAALVLLALASIPIVLILRVRAAERAWAASFGPIDAIPARFRTESNATADDLAERAESLGISIGLQNTMSALTVGSNHLSDQTLTALVMYIDAETARPSNAAEPPPADVRAYARERARQLDAFADWVLATPPPQWHLELDVMGQVPNFLGLIKLHRVILASAVARAADSDHHGAEKLLQASWRLNESLRSSGLIIVQIISVTIFRAQLGVMRKIDIDSGMWLPRLREHDYRQSMVGSHEAEAWLLDRSVRENIFADPRYIESRRAIMLELGPSQPQYDAALRPRWKVLAQTPIRWFDLPSILEGQREMLLAARAAPVSPDIGRQAAAAYARGALRWWYVPDDDVQTFDPSGAFVKIARAEAERELTEKVLKAKAARAANRNRWPSAIAGFAESSIAGHKWTYTGGQRGAVIRIQPDLQWPDPIVDVPLFFEVR